MKKVLLKKFAIGASAFLLLGGVIGSANFAKDASANGVPGVPMYMNEHQNKYSKILQYVAKADNKFTAAHHYKYTAKMMKQEDRVDHKAYLRAIAKYGKKSHRRNKKARRHNKNTIKRNRRAKRSKKFKHVSKRARDIKRLKAVNKHDHAKIFAHFGKNKFRQYGKGGSNLLPYAKTNWAVHNFYFKY